MKENIAEAKRWFESYMKLRSLGQAGKILSEEYQLFLRRYTKEQIEDGFRDGLNLMDWCIVKAQEAPGV